MELVVARYREDLRWLKRVPKSLRVVVYDKSTDLPNIGREAHTYLHHIVARYDTLAELTVFSQGKPFDHAFDFHTSLKRLAENPGAAPEFLWLGHAIDRDDRDGTLLFQKWSKNESGRKLPMDDFCRAVWNEPSPETLTFFLGAQFAARRELILKQPRAFYERALRVAATFPDAAHCFERCWDRVFGVCGIPPEHQNRSPPIYLKPIRRLQSGIPR